MCSLDASIHLADITFPVSAKFMSAKGDPEKSAAYSALALRNGPPLTLWTQLHSFLPTPWGPVMEAKACRWQVNTSWTQALCWPSPPEK
eukprot:1762941-Rhodomonas_salina.1